MARNESIELFERLELRAKRAAAIRAEIVNWCQAGDLIAAVSPTVDGPISPIAPDAWNTERLATRFRTLQFPLAETFPPSGHEGAFGWIFITAASLERVRKLRNAKKKAKPYRSIYMKTLTEVIEKEGITLENQSKVALLSQLFMDKLKGIQPPISKHITDVMATIIREPESQRLRGGRPPNRPKLGKAPNRKS
jgi:hypothetical protein